MQLKTNDDDDDKKRVGFVGIGVAYLIERPPVSISQHLLKTSITTTKNNNGVTAALFPFATLVGTMMGVGYNDK